MFIIHILRQGQGALKFASGYFAAKIFAFLLFFFLSRGPDGNRLIADGDIQIIFFNARQCGLNLYFIVVIDDIYLG